MYRNGKAGELMDQSMWHVVGMASLAGLAFGAAVGLTVVLLVDRAWEGVGRIRKHAGGQGFNNPTPPPKP